MRRIICFALLFGLMLLLSRPAHAGPYYFYTWSSPKPVNLASIHVGVEGGAMTSNYVSDDRMWGTVNVDAPRECVVITWHSETDSGIPMYDHIVWDAECTRMFLPVVVTPTGDRTWWP